MTAPSKPPVGSVKRYVSLIKSVTGSGKLFRMTPDEAALGLISALVDPESTIIDDTERAQCIRNVIEALNTVTGREY